MFFTDSQSEYLQQLEIVRKIRDTIKAHDEISLPQICVIGDQSSGKSSFLSRLTGVRFPTAAKMCTKAAVVVSCNRDTSLTAPRYEIEDWKSPGVYHEISSTEEAIQKTQDELLKKMANQIGEHWNSDGNCVVADQSIKLRVTSPTVIDIIVVDLPGIQHAGSTKDSILALIEKNIEKPETLNLLISEAKQDAELTKAIEIAEKYDPDHVRTIRVLSKFDNFDTPATRERAVRLIHEGQLHAGTMSSKATGALDLGPHAIVSIGKEGNLQSDQEELAQLTGTYQLNRDRAGIDTLKKRLQPLFARLIKTHLPMLKKIVSDNLNTTQVALGELGREPKSPVEIVNTCQQILRQKVEELERDLSTKCLLPLKNDINATKKKVTLDFATPNFEINSFHCVLFQGQQNFEAAVKKIQGLWKPIVDDFIKKAAEIMFESMHCLRKEQSTQIYGKLISAIQAEHQEHIQKMLFHDSNKLAQSRLSKRAPTGQ